MNPTETFSDASLVFPVEAKSYSSEKTAEQLSVQVADSLPAVEGLRPLWTAWSHNLNTDLDYYLDNLKRDPTVLRPYVITVSKRGIPQAMLVGLVRKCRVSTVVSSVNIHGPKARVLEVIAGGRMGLESAGSDRLFVLQLHKALRSGRVDLVCFQRLPMQSQLLRELRQMPGFLMKERVPHIFRYLVAPLAPTFGKRAPALSGKNGREARRKTRILQRAFPGRTRFHCFSEPGELEDGLRDATTVRVTTWQHYLDGRVLNAPNARAKFAFCAQQGWLRIYVLYVDGSPVAFLIGQHYQQKFYCQHAGYRPDFARYSVGSLLTAWAFESLASAGVEQVDLGEGGQEHNRRMGGLVCKEGLVHVYAPTLRGLSVNLFFAVAQIARAAGRSVLTELRLNRLSKAWSQFLISRWNRRNGVSHYVLKKCA
jgi:GNAT acetyltransferase-like protein